MNLSLRSLVSRASWPFFVASTLLVWCALLVFPEPCSGRFLDQSWALALAHFMKGRAQAGTDYVFTYGPLGYLAVPLFFPGLFGLKYVWALVVAAASAVVLVRFATRIPSRALQVVWLWLVLAILPRSELQMVVVLVVMALLHVLEQAWSHRRLALTAALFATVGLVKFTFLLLGTGLVVILAFAAPREARRRVASRLIPLFVSFLGGVWLAAGQSLRNVPLYLARSYEIASGYSAAMSLDGTSTPRAAALTVGSFVLPGALLVVPEVSTSRKYLSGVAMVGLGLFLSWKEGFVRQDPTHVGIFFGYAALGTVMLRTLDERPDAPTRLLSGAFLLLGALSSVSVLRSINRETATRFFALSAREEQAARSLETLWSPLTYEARAEAVWRSEQMKWALPKVRARVGGAPLDVMTVDQQVLLYNGLNFHPRPVFQSYTAYTPALALLNGEFFRGPDRPRYVLMRWLSIDTRFPADDDAVALVEVLRRYRPVLSERDYLLFERLPNGPMSDARGETVLQKRLPFDERLPLSLDPKDTYTLSVRLEPTIAGRIRRFLFRGPRLDFLLEQAGGRRHRYELVSDLASVPFLLSPLFEGNFEVPKIYSGNGRVVAAIRFAGTAESRLSFGNSVEVTIRRYPGIGREALPPGAP